MFVPSYSKWRHGGWYVDNVRYPSGAVGCVSRNFDDGKWRIVCDERAGEHTYPSRDAAALAELEIARAAFEKCQTIADNPIGNRADSNAERPYRDGHRERPND